MLLQNLLSVRSSGDKGRNSAHHFPEKQSITEDSGHQLLLPCHNSFLWGGEQFHFPPELSAMGSNNSAALHRPDSWVKPTEQNVTNRSSGKRGVATRLKWTTKSPNSSASLITQKALWSQSKPMSQIHHARNEERGNKHGQSMATASSSPSRLQVLTETVFTAIPLPGEVNLFLMQNFFSLSLFLSLRPTPSSLRKQGLRVYTCDPNFPFCVRLFFFFLRKTIQEKFLNHCFSLGHWLPTATEKLFIFKCDPHHGSSQTSPSPLSKSLPRPSFFLHTWRVNINLSLSRYWLNVMTTLCGFSSFLDFVLSQLMQNTRGCNIARWHPKRGHGLLLTGQNTEGLLLYSTDTA